jgi:hypothetical protein
VEAGKYRNERVIAGIVALSLLIAAADIARPIFSVAMSVGLTQIFGKRDSATHAATGNCYERDRDALSLMQDVNRGLNDALGAGGFRWARRAIPAMYHELLRAQDALRYVQNVYGNSVDSSELKVQQDADQTAAEAISLNNSIYGYAKEIDQIGEDIKRNSNIASRKAPKNSRRNPLVSCST